MPFYLRKSFRFGPIRLNLSKSGVTPSIGVTGARVGLRAGGRAYVHAGRAGLYYRRSLGGAGAGRGGGAGVAGPGRRVLHQETGAAFAGPAAPGGGAREVEAPAQAAPLASPLPWAAGLGALLLAAVAAASSGPARWAFGLGAAAAAGAALALGLARWREGQAALGLGAALADLPAAGPLAPERRQVIEAALAHPSLREADRARLAREAYTEAACQVVADGRVTPEQRALLEDLEGLLALGHATCRAARLAAFQQVFLAAVADHELTEDEEETLEHVRSALGLADEELREELDVLDRLRRLRRIRAGDIPEIEPSRPLQRAETCYYEAPARLLRERNLRSFQRDGTRYSVRGLLVDKEGTLLVTEKRLLLLHQGSTAIPLSRILDLEVDADENVMRIVRDGRARPTILSTPDSLEAGAIVATLAGL